MKRKKKKAPFKTPMKITKAHNYTGGVNRPHPVIQNGMQNQSSNAGAKRTVCAGECVGQEKPNLC